MNISKKRIKTMMFVGLASVTMTGPILQNGALIANAANLNTNVINNEFINISGAEQALSFYENSKYAEVTFEKDGSVTIEIPDSKLLDFFEEQGVDTSNLEYLDQTLSSARANGFGYPCEEFLDDCFSEYYHHAMKEYITSITTQFIENKDHLKLNQKEEAILLISSDIYGCFFEVRDFKYGEEDKIRSLISDYYEKNIKDKAISFNDHYLVGNLINILNDDSKTESLISDLSSILTKKNFSTFFGGKELVEIIQTIRPDLIKLYAEKTDEDFYDWFEK